MPNDNSTKLTNPWFEHDENASSDGKFLKMFRDFRKLAKTMEQSELESFVALGAYAIFWRLAEFMHGNNLAVGDEDIIADELRINTKFVEKILNEYGLFYQENGLYISNRILRNLERRQEKSKKNSGAANIRWLLYAFNEAYKEFFNEVPVLSNEEIDNLKKYSKKIPDLKDKLRDIIYTLSTLKFNTDIKFKPCANWLLDKNNLARLVNGEFGRLKHKPTEKELKEKELQKQQEAFQENKPTELELKAQSIDSKAEALYLLAQNTRLVNNKVVVLYTLKFLQQKFGITDKEIKAYIKDVDNAEL